MYETHWHELDDEERNKDLSYEVRLAQAPHVANDLLHGLVKEEVDITLIDHGLKELQLTIVVLLSKPTNLNHVDINLSQRLLVHDLVVFFFLPLLWIDILSLAIGHLISLECLVLLFFCIIIRLWVKGFMPLLRGDLAESFVLQVLDKVLVEV